MDGYELPYDDFSGMDEALSAEKCRFVLDILSTYRIISSSFYRLPKLRQKKTLPSMDLMEMKRLKNTPSLSFLLMTTIDLGI